MVSTKQDIWNVNISEVFLSNYMTDAMIISYVECQKMRTTLCKSIQIFRIVCMQHNKSFSSNSYSKELFTETQPVSLATEAS